MERNEALTELPVVYQQVVALVDAGCSERQISAHLKLDPVAIAPLIAIAQAKLARLTDPPSEER